MALAFQLVQREKGKVHGARCTVRRQINDRRGRRDCRDRRAGWMGVGWGRDTGQPGQRTQSMVDLIQNASERYRAPVTEVQRLIADRCVHQDLRVEHVAHRAPLQ